MQAAVEEVGKQGSAAVVSQLVCVEACEGNGGRANSRTLTYPRSRAPAAKACDVQLTTGEVASSNRTQTMEISKAGGRSVPSGMKRTRMRRKKDKQTPIQTPAEDSRTKLWWGGLAATNERDQQRTWHHETQGHEGTWWSGERGGTKGGSKEKS